MSSVSGSLGRRRSSLLARGHAGYVAFVIHRLSGVALTLFLPLHFLVLALAIEGDARLDGFIHWTERPLVHLSEIVLVGLLAAHMAGGVRLLLTEWVGQAPRARTALITVVAASAAAALLFGLSSP